VLTEISFGLVAVVIGFLAGHGAVRFAGGKRGTSLQAIRGHRRRSVVPRRRRNLVNMTLSTSQNTAAAGERLAHSLPAAQRERLFYRVLAVNFGMMKLVFLAIVVYEAWVIPRPPKLDLAA